MTRQEALKDAQYHTVVRDGIHCTAVLSSDARYRYSLGRVWDGGLGIARFIGLNPSTATHEEDDPTIRRCMRFARDWGLGGIVMLNIFAYRATDPKALQTVPHPVGALTDYYLETLGSGTHPFPVIACWGVHGELHARGAAAFAILKRASRDQVQVFGFTKGGHPKHPLYLRAASELVPWR